MKCRKCSEEFEPSRIKWFNRQGFCSLKCAEEARHPIKAGIVKTEYKGKSSGINIIELNCILTVIFVIIIIIALVIIL